MPACGSSDSFTDPHLLNSEPDPMDWKTTLAGITLAAAVAGVGYWAVSQRSARAAFEESVPACTTAAECAAGRSAAREWVTAHTLLPIETDNDQELRTATLNPELHDSSVMAITVTYVPAGDGTTRIEFAGECTSPTCPSWDAGAQFNQFVGDAIRSTAR